MKILPINYGICFELAYPSSKIRQTRSLRHQLDLNCFVDAVLRTIYHTSAALGGSFSRRRVIFTSFCPDACSALNWKQPNCESRYCFFNKQLLKIPLDPVFFASRCGQKLSPVPSRTALSVEDVADPRLSSLCAAVEFSKMNNLVGVFLDAHALVSLTITSQWPLHLIANMYRFKFPH